MPVPSDVELDREDNFGLKIASFVHFTLPSERFFLHLPTRAKGQNNEFEDKTYFLILVSHTRKVLCSSLFVPFFDILLQKRLGNVNGGRSVSSIRVTPQ